MDGQKTDVLIPPYGNDWEVVSLTASAYAAAPGPKKFEQSNEMKDSVYIIEHESFGAVFKSGHFILPSNENENLLRETDIKEVQNRSSKQDDSFADKSVDEASKLFEESYKIKSDDDLHGIHFLDKQKRPHMDEMEFVDGRTLEDLSSVGKGHAMLVSSGLNAFHAESEIGNSTCHSKSDANVDASYLSYPPLDSSGDPTNSLVVEKDNGTEGSGLSCEAWWKRQVILLYKNAREATTFWSVFVGAALVGIVVFGQRWQREKMQVQPFKLQFEINNERISCNVGPHSRFQGILVADRQPGPLFRS